VANVKENDLYFYNQPVEEILPGMRVRVHGREMGMYASYSYLGLINHPRINEAAKRAVD
jgi:7-keto-8-aminopelargonate synthetase-like enzyme